MRPLIVASQFVLLALGLSWLTAALLLTGAAPGEATGARATVASLLVLAVGLAVWSHSRPVALGVLALLCGAVFAWTHTARPSLTRDWAPHLTRASRAAEQGTQVTVHDVRDFRYRSTTDWDAAWYSATYD